MHRQNAPRQDFSVLSDAEVPRLDPHHVIKHELEVKASLHTNLRQGEVKRFRSGSSGSAPAASYTLCLANCTCVNMGLPFWVTMVH